MTDPEKYHDAALHDDFLRAWLPRLARQVVIVNKADRLDAEDGRRIRSDLETDLAASRSASGSQVDVLLTSAAPTPDIGGLQRVAVRRGRGQGRRARHAWPRPSSTLSMA